MNSEKLTVLHDHYRDTCTMLQTQRTSRDRYVYFVVAALLVALFDIATPQGFANTIADVLAARLELAASPDLGYIRSLLWFLLFAFTIRYLQTMLAVERYSGYIHALETLLSAEIDGAFTGEGERYLGEYPLWLDWSHLLETIAFPLLLAIVATMWTYRQVPSSWPWPWTVWFNGLVTVVMLAWIAMYFIAMRYVSSLHRRDHGQAARPRPGRQH